MQALRSIALLTLKAALRFRLVLLLAGILLASVVILPLIIKDDGTAEGFTQIILTYTLSVTTALLGFATLWLACGTLARDIEDCHIQMVAVKPVPRWQIWLGKWCGIMLLNASLLAVAGLAIYGLMMWRMHHLPPKEQAKLRSQVLVARGSAKEAVPNLEPQIEALLKKRLQQDPSLKDMDRNFLRQQLRIQVQAAAQYVPPNYRRRWVIDLGLAARYLKDKPLFLRVKFQVPPDQSYTLEPRTYLTTWIIGPPNGTNTVARQIKLAAKSFQEIKIPPNLFDKDGKLTIEFRNYTDTALLFPLEDGMEVLYPESTFGINFIRGLGIILCWLGLLAAVGLMAAAFLSFPVAAFFSIALLTIAFSTGTMSQVIHEGGITGVNHNTGTITTPNWLDRVSVFFFKGTLDTVNLVRGFSPIDHLSTGRSITWFVLMKAFAQVVLLMGGVLGLIGTWIFTRRELATAQTQ